jgi:hypothetical protein
VWSSSIWEKWNGYCFVQVLLKEGAVQCAVIIDLVEKEQLLLCAGAAERRRGAVCGHHRFGGKGTVIVLCRCC